MFIEAETGEPVFAPEERNLREGLKYFVPPGLANKSLVYLSELQSQDTSAAGDTFSNEHE